MISSKKRSISIIRVEKAKQRRGGDIAREEKKRCISIAGMPLAFPGVIVPTTHREVPGGYVTASINANTVPGFQLGTRVIDETVNLLSENTDKINCWAISETRLSIEEADERTTNCDQIERRSSCQSQLNRFNGLQGSS